ITIAGIASRGASVPIKTLRADAPVTAAAITDDASGFALGFDTGEVIAVLSHGNHHVRLKGHAGRVLRIHFGLGARSLISATEREVAIWDFQTEAAVVLCDPKSSTITDLAVDSTGRYAAWTTKDGRVSVYALTTGQTFSFNDHRGWALAADFSSDG